MNIVSNEAYFYLFQNGETDGPMTGNELADKARIGAIRDDTLACQAGEQEWVLISSHPVVREIVAAPLSEWFRENERKNQLDRLLSVEPKIRDAVVDKLSSIRVFYGNPDEKLGPITLWQVVDLIDANILSLDIRICVVGSDYWREAVSVAGKLCLGK